MLEVKCKRCRFRYEVEIGLGQKELDCVCPRCGTPFKYVVPDDYMRGDNLSHGTEDKPYISEESISEVEFASPSAMNVVEGSEVSTSVDGSSQISLPPPVPPAIPLRTIPPPNPSPKGTSFPPTNNRKGSEGSCMKGCLIFFVLLALLIWGAKSCNRHSAEDEDDAPVETRETVEDQTDNATKEPKTLSLSVLEGQRGQKDNADTTAQEAVLEEELPAWVEGIWYGEAPYGRIIMLIRGNQITIRVDKKMRSGTLSYSEGMLHCRFSEGKIQDYRLDFDKLQIITGDGLRMIKE